MGALCHAAFHSVCFPRMSDSSHPLEWWSWHPAGIDECCSQWVSGFGHRRAFWILLATSRVGQGPQYVKAFLSLHIPLTGWIRLGPPALCPSSPQSEQVLFSGARVQREPHQLPVSSVWEVELVHLTTSVFGTHVSVRQHLLSPHSVLTWWYQSCLDPFTPSLNDRGLRMTTTSF